MIEASADLVLLNGKIITVNPNQSSADAVAIKGDRILRVGTEEEIRSFIGENTSVIRLRGKTVVPGLIDTHIHVADFGRVLMWLDLENMDSISNLQKCLSKRSRETPNGKWILGKGWNNRCFREKRLPTRFDLDFVSPDNPVVFYHKSGKICVLNSKALELAGLTASVKAKTNSGIGIFEETGELTGILENDAMNIVWRVIPEPSEEELLESVYLAFSKIIEAGVTSIHWIVTTPVEISIMRKLERHKLNLRVHVIIAANLLDKLSSSELRGGFADGQLKVGSVLIFADGYLAARTAALSQPYEDNHASNTGLLYTQEEMNRLAAKAAKTDLQLVIHAVGDTAIDAALTAFESASTEAYAKDLRNRIEQAAVLNQELLERIKKQKVIVSVQPMVIASEFSVWNAADRLGVKRSRLLFPLKTLQRKGACVISGSDCPMEPLNPLSGIQAAVTRESFPEERVMVDDALHMYTVNAAYASFEEDLKGSIEVGKLADLAVLSTDPRIVPQNKIKKITVEYTIIGGKIVYQNPV